MALTVSVIIPTYKRPEFLLRAIDSAFSNMPMGTVEVIVVPNGGDASWKSALETYKSNPFLRVEPIAKAHANAARNRGLAVARGKLIRFLDDDDYLFPKTASKQYDFLLNSDCDVSSGALNEVTHTGDVVKPWSQPEFSDFTSAVYHSSRNTVPVVHAFKAESIRGVFWSESDDIRQDVFWLMDLCKERSLSWHRTNDVVGAWVHHPSERVSLANHQRSQEKIPEKYYWRERATAERIMANLDVMLENRELDSGQIRAIAEGLWGCIHSGFYTDTKYWRGVAAFVRSVDPFARPCKPLYQWPILRRVDPLLIQYLLAYKRKLAISSRYRKRVQGRTNNDAPTGTK